MIKKIPVDKLEIGMYIHDLDCSWMNHPFMRNSFFVSTQEEMRQLRKTNISELYIDTERGKDVSAGSSAPDVREEVADEPEGLGRDSKAEQKVSLYGEQARARKVYSEANQVISNLMYDVRMGRQVKLEAVSGAVTPLVSSVFRNKDALLGLTRIRHMDKYTFEHSVSVAVMMVSFAKQLKMDRDNITRIGIGALLHDIGKIRTPSHILNKPGKLTDEELVIMREHVVHSREILKQAPGIDPISLAVAAEHHERVDGRGYPEGKKGEEISLYGRMAAIVDVYDAMTAHRVYRRGIEPHVVLGKLIEWSKSQFEPVLVQRFVQSVGIYPVGTLVSLASGRAAVVLASGNAGLLYPLVRVVYDIDKQKYLKPFDLDLSQLPSDSDERILSAQSFGTWGIDPNKYLG